MIGERTEKEEDDEEENIDLHEELDKDRAKRTRIKGRRNNAPKSKKKKLNVVSDDHDCIKEPIANKEKKFKSNDPKEAPNVTTQNLFSIFNSNSKFTNTPGSKVRKRAKPQTKKPTVSKIQNIKQFLISSI